MSEQQEILATFSSMLAAATGDGQRKREAGTKPHWKVDPSHLKAIFSHMHKYFAGEKVDADSGAHPLVHLAWRALALAWQETHPATVGAFSEKTLRAEAENAWNHGRSVFTPEIELRQRRGQVVRHTYGPTPPAIYSGRDAIADALDLPLCGKEGCDVALHQRPLSEV
jgi:hypothetical protein